MTVHEVKQEAKTIHYYEGMNSQNIEDLIQPSTLVMDALHEMKRYRNWTASTIDAYIQDVQQYSSFCYSINEEPILSTARLHLVDQWTKKQKGEGVAVSTIERRLASLSSIYKFYKELGTVSSNPFKIAEAPIGLKGHHSRDLDLEEISRVFHCLEIMKEDGFDVDITVRVMLLTGLRNNALTMLKVKDINFEEQLLYYDAGIFNSKHKIQIFPIPPKLFSLLREHIKNLQLQPDDTLLNGLKGYSLRAKQLNRITDKICEYLGWVDELHVTPHGFRASIATMLHERGVSRDTIKFLLGHSDKKDNLYFYLRRNRKKLNRLRHELTLLEQEIEEGVERLKQKEGETGSKEERELEVQHHPSMESSPNQSTKISQAEFLQILKVNKTAALALVEQNLVSFE